MPQTKSSIMTSVLPSFVLVFFLAAQISGFIFHFNLDNLEKYEKSVFEFVISTAFPAKFVVESKNVQSHLLSFVLHSSF